MLVCELDLARESVNVRRSKAAWMNSVYVDVVVDRDTAASEDRGRIIELYGHLRPSLQAFLGSRGLSKEHTEDVIQEVFLRFVRQVLRSGVEQNPTAWVFRVAHNLSMDHHRLERRRLSEAEFERHAVFLRERVDPSPNPEQMLIIGERIQRFKTAFSQLTPKQRHCVLLRARGLRYREIALEMGVSVQRVGELMQRAISSFEGGT